MGWNSAEQLQGKELSYNNLLDLESALSTVLEFGYEEKDEPTTDTFACLLYTSPSPRDLSTSRMPSSA